MLLRPVPDPSALRCIALYFHMTNGTFSAYLRGFNVLKNALEILKLSCPEKIITVRPGLHICNE